MFDFSKRTAKQLSINGDLCTEAKRISRPTVRRPFLLKRVKKEASCSISLKEGRGWALVGRYPAVFC